MKKILITGGMLTYMMMFNAGITSAALLPDITASELQTSTTQESIRHEKNFEAKIVRIATKLGIDPDLIARDIKSNKSTKDILQKYGITKRQLNSVLGKTVSHTRKNNKRG